MNPVLTHTLVFVIYFLSSWSSTRWVDQCTTGRMWWASGSSSLYHMLHGVAVLLIVFNPWCIITVGISGFVGTIVPMWNKQRKLSACPKHS